MTALYVLTLALFWLVKNIAIKAKLDCRLVIHTCSGVLRTAVDDCMASWPV